jgi:hypothetical protein
MAGHDDPSEESSNAGGLQQQGAPISCETGVFTKSSARTLSLNLELTIKN